MKIDSEGKYEGHWRNDKKSGEGVLTLRNGDKLIGRWRDNQIVGEVNIDY